jgi:Rap1a immunity proteins
MPHICLIPSDQTPVSDGVQIDQELASGAICDVLAAAVGGPPRGWYRPTEEALRTFLAVAFMVMFTVEANAKFLDGNTLHGWCISGDVGNQAACLGYVIGVADVLSSEHRGEPREYRACIPEMDATRIVSTVKKYLESHPWVGNITASDLVVVALSEAFPCP